MTTKLMDAVKAKGPQGEQALAALAELLRTAKRREQWKQSKRRIRARERAHRSWVNRVGTVNGKEIRPLPMSYVRALNRVAQLDAEAKAYVAANRTAAEEHFRSVAAEHISESEARIRKAFRAIDKLVPIDVTATVVR